MSLGIVKAISEKNNSVLIWDDEVKEEIWFKLGEKVKPQYVKKGKCEYTEKNNVISFIKCEGDAEESPKKSYKPSTSKVSGSMYISYAKDLIVAGTPLDQAIATIQKLREVFE